MKAIVTTLSIVLAATGCNQGKAGSPSTSTSSAAERGPSAQAAGSLPSVGEVLKNVRRVYRDAQSYRDDGEVESFLVTKKGERRPAGPPSSFSTWYVRPDKLRFEFRGAASAPGSSLTTMVIATSTKSAWVRYEGRLEGRKDATKRDSLSFALGEVAGLSEGVSPILPGLLLNLEEDLYGAWRGADEASPSTADAVDGTACYRFDVTREPHPGTAGLGLSRPDTTEAVWVEQGTYLVRRVVTKNKLPSDWVDASADVVGVESTIRYRPRLGVKIEANTFDSSRSLPAP